MYSPVSYFTNDEGSLTCYTDELDVCFCKYCMEKMRDWLKDEYPSLDALNKEWKTNFGSWTDIIPYTYEESRKINNFAAWTDHRRFMEIGFVNAYKQIRDIIREFDPPARARMSGTQSPTPYSGYDYYLLHQVVGFFEAYPGGNQFELHRSFRKPDTVIGRWSGYGVSGVTAKNNIWEVVFHDMNLVSIFWEYAFLNMDFTFSKSAVDYAEVFKEIRREGIGKLLLYSAKRDNMNIAVHYSMNCIHGSYTNNTFEKYEGNRGGWLKILEDLGYQYTMLSTPQIELGALNGSKNKSTESTAATESVQQNHEEYKVLIMPYAISLSKKESDEIREFVNSGGFVIADFQTGIMNEHSTLSDKGSLDDMFGISRVYTESRKFNLDQELEKNNNFDLSKFPLHLTKSEIASIQLPDVYGRGDIFIAEGGTRLDGGTPAYLHTFGRKVPGVTFNGYGTGTAVYLNFAVDKYMSFRQDKNCSIRDIIKKILEISPVRKTVSLYTTSGEPIEHGYETICYNDINARYIGILRELDENTRLGFDGLPVNNAFVCEKRDESVIIKLDEKAYIYDVREKSFVGFTNIIETCFTDGDAKLYSVLQYKVDDILIHVPEKVACGDKLEVDIVVYSDIPYIEHDNVLAVKFIDPDGEYSIHYSENIIIKEKEYQKTVSIPYNEKTGTWTIEVKDVATGNSTVRTFRVI